jgi:hypothetical protein
MVLESRGSRDTKTVNLETLKHFRTHIWDLPQLKYLDLWSISLQIKGILL